MVVELVDDGPFTVIVETDESRLLSGSLQGRLRRPGYPGLMAVPALYQAQSMILLVLGVLALATELFALIDALRRPAAAFPYADKRTKQFWSIVLAVAAAVGFISLWNVTSLVGLLGVVAAGIYLADVRPAVSQYTSRGGSTGGHGPYGTW